MNRFWLTPVLALAALSGFACTIDKDSAIPAAAPAGNFGQSGSVSGGTYDLYRVTQWDMWGAPTNAQKITSVNLNANEHLGFDYELPKDKQYSPDAQSDVIAYAGSRRINLGPIHSMDEQYFWATDGQWDGYWAGRPTRVLARRFTLN